MSHYKKRTNPIWPILAIVFAAYIILQKIDFSGFGGNICESYGRTEISEGKCSTIDGYEKVAIIFGNTQNVQTLKKDLSSDSKIKNVIADAFFASNDPNSSNLSMYSVSNPNTSVVSKNKTQGPAKNLNASRDKLEHNFSIIKEMSKTRPSQDGADYMGTIIRAAEDNKSNKTAIIVIGSGLSDRGMLNFADNNKYLKGNTSASQIFGSGNNYDQSLLSKTDIYWVNIGRVVSPQEKLYSVEGLKKTYNSALKFFGMKNNFTEITIDSDEKSIDTDKTVKTTKPIKITISMGEKIAKFKAESDEFFSDAEKEKAKNWLKEKLTNNNQSIEITGYIDASLNNCPENNSSLPNRRAERVKQLLVEELGFSANNISTNGYAAHPPEDDSKEPFSCKTPMSADNRTVMISWGG